MEVNPQLLFVSIDLSGSGKSAIGQDQLHPNDIQITGFRYAKGFGWLI
jgi:hypothetical protein